MDPFFDIVNDLEFLFSSLVENNLRSFRYEDFLRMYRFLCSWDIRWELGSCIPEDVLWLDSEFVARQKRIEIICLITDGDCGSNF